MIYAELQQSISVSDVEVTFSQGSVSIIISQASSGLIIFFAGAVGLFLMTLRVPAKEVLGYKTEGGGGSTMGLLLRRKILASCTINIPLPVWWLVRSSERLERVEEKA